MKVFGFLTACSIDGRHVPSGSIVSMPDDTGARVASLGSVNVCDLTPRPALQAWGTIAFGRPMTGIRGYPCPVCQGVRRMLACRICNNNGRYADYP